MAASDGGGRLCVDSGPRRSDETDGAHEAGGGRHVFAQQTAEEVETGGVGNGLDRVDRALDLRVAAGEVEGDVGMRLPSRCRCRRGKPRLYGGRLFGGRSGNVDSYGYAHGFVFDAIVIEEVFGLVLAGRDGTQEGSHHFFGIDEQIDGGLAGPGRSVAGAAFTKTLAA